MAVAIDVLFATRGLSISRIRGQGFDGASNMNRHISGLKSLIQAENASAFYVHCFAHQLQLTLVAVSKKHDKICSFFDHLASLVNFVGASCKRKELVLVKQIEKLAEEISQGNRMTGKGLNQEAVLKRPGDTRWGSHYHTILSVISLFSPALDVLEEIKDMPSFHENKGEIYRLIDAMNDFEFIFLLHLMRKVLGITNDLSQALQRKDQDLANALCLVNVSKKMLQTFRDDGWNELIVDVSKFCEKFEIDVPDMDAISMPRGRSRRKLQKVSNKHHFKISLMNTIIDYQLQEINERLDRDNMELLSCISCLNPQNSF
ncbi:uncharacterized protein LOC141705083 [Apium graveolens]|uniref:uncharacterized protein LOC141705083 n=1 Tax=Apium graveolens TaxID=4045 RepID=UPI003D7C0EFF